MFSQKERRRAGRKLRRKAHGIMLKKHDTRRSLKAKIEDKGVQVPSIVSRSLKRLKALFTGISGTQKKIFTGLPCAFNVKRQEKKAICRQLGITGKRYQALMKKGRREIKSRDPEATFI